MKINETEPKDRDAIFAAQHSRGAWAHSQKQLNDKRFGITHAEFSKTDPMFKNACEKAGVEPTIRQASKWRNKKGKAYAAR